MEAEGEGYYTAHRDQAGIRMYVTTRGNNRGSARRMVEKVRDASRAGCMESRKCHTKQASRIKPLAVQRETFRSPRRMPDEEFDNFP